MKFKNTEVFNFEGAFRGMRNPMNSWNKSDSNFNNVDSCMNPDPNFEDCQNCKYFDGFGRACIPYIGSSDMKLAQNLIKAGSADRKFMRQIFVSVDITAPLYWWKEYDTYKVGTVANSTSTMHKLATTPITLECFETDDMDEHLIWHSKNELPWSIETTFKTFVESLEDLRQAYLETKDKKYWKELIRLLPESWLQTRTVTMNYENIYSMIRQRRNHKLNEWSGKDNPNLPNFIGWARSLPYADELLFFGLDRKEEKH